MKTLMQVLVLSALTALIINMLSLNFTMGCVVGAIAATGAFIWKTHG
jgi:hypothetical protein